jgi:uncharacterized protein
MRWTSGGKSEDVEDRRGGGGGGGLGLPIGRLGIGGFIVLAALSLIFKKNFFALLGQGGGEAPSGPAPTSAEEEKLVQFVSFVLDDAQRTWSAEFPKQLGGEYGKAKLVIFTDRVRSGCGAAESAMGPFYCPADSKVYIDLGFYRALAKRLGAPGDFAQAYVIAHELGHHVQNLRGTERELRTRQRGKSETEKNALSVRMELQADCFAGIWAHGTQKRDLLEQGDVEEALGAAAAVGDDRLSGSANQERWTHGSAAMRTRWFKKGMSSGKIADCDTFAATEL